MPYNYRDIVRRLEKLWFRKVRQKGSHVMFSNGKELFPVPYHGSRDISPGVEKKLLMMLRMTRKEFDAI